MQLAALTRFRILSVKITDVLLLEADWQISKFRSRTFLIEPNLWFQKVKTFFFGVALISKIGLTIQSCLRY